MINITVKKRKGSYLDFLSKGHAGYAEEGQDIVCAAVSALIITTVNSLEKFTEEQLEAEADEGYVSIHFKTNPNTERGDFPRMEFIQDFWLTRSRQIRSWIFSEDSGKRRPWCWWIRLWEIMAVLMGFIQKVCGNGWSSW